MPPRSRRPTTQPTQVASSSRRPTRAREPSSEEADAAAARVPRPSPRKPSAPRRRASPEDEDGDDDEDGEGGERDVKPFTRATWTNRPVDPNAERVLKGFLTNWAMPAGDMEARGPALLADTARALEDAGGDEELAMQLEQSIRKMVDTQHLIRAHTSTLDDLRQQLARREKLADIADKYTTGTAELAEEYGRKTARQRYAKAASYFQFREGVWQGMHGEEKSMPPDFVGQALGREAGDDSESDEEIVLGGQTQELKCPLTLRFLTAALTSSKCKHSYSRTAILEYLDGGRSRKKCPATGCDEVIGAEDLGENKGLERAARRAEQRERDVDAGLDDEEEVEEVD